MNICKVALLAGLLAAAPASAQTINRIQNLAQQEFRLLSEDLGGALSYHPQTPTTPLGVTGFDVGFALTGARLHNTTIEGAAVAPAIGVRGPLPKLSGVDQLSLATRGIDVSISKGFAVLT